MALAKTTQDHDEIRRWAEERGGKPGAVKSTEKGDDPGILRLFFPKAPHHNDDAIEEISWEEFFEKFDESGLELTYQEETADGQKSDFNKLTYPDPESTAGKKLLRKSAGKKGAKKAAGKKSAGKTAAKKAPAKKIAAKKTPAKKSAGKKAATKSASRKSSSESPARNYPKPEHGNSQVF